MTLYDYEQKFYKNLDNGEPRLKGIKRALDSAIEKNDISNIFELYYEYLKEDIFHFDCFNSVIIFPECLAFFENHPECQSEYAHDIMWMFKWMIGNFSDFHQIPKAQIEGIFDKYQQFCDKFGYSKRTYYMKYLDYVYDELFDGEDISRLEEIHKKMLKCKDDTLSDCRACTLNNEVWYELRVRKDINKALTKADPILSGRLVCAEIPHCTYTHFARHYLENNDLQNAKFYADKAYRLFERDYSAENSYHSHRGVCLEIFAYTDIKKAIKVFQKTFPMACVNRNSFDCFRYFRSAYYFMLQLERNGQKNIKVSFPLKTEKIYKKDNIYSVTELKEWIYNKAKFYADKFDERNQNDYRNRKLKKEWVSNPFEYIHSIPILNCIRENMKDGVLERDFMLPHKYKEDDLNFIDGAKDGIMFYHMSSKKVELVDELKDIISLAGKGEIKKAFINTEKCFKDENKAIFRFVDAVQNFIIENQDSFEIENIYNFAVKLTVFSVNKESVKLGLIILEIFQIFDDELKEAIIDLALCNEFTLYCLWVIARWKKDSGYNENEVMFDIAKKVHGWGRIHAVRMLNAETEEIKDWMLKYGCDNDVLPEYSALDCFLEVDIPKLLKDGLTQEQLTPVGKILSYILSEGPVMGISGVENPNEVLTDYLSNAEKLERTEEDNEIIEKIKNNFEDEIIKSKCDEILEKSKE